MFRSILLLLTLCFFLSVVASAQNPAPIICLKGVDVLTTGKSDNIVRTLKYVNLPLLLKIEKKQVTIYGPYLGEKPNPNGQTDYSYKIVDRECYKTREDVATYVRGRYKGSGIFWVNP